MRTMFFRVFLSVFFRGLSVCLAIRGPHSPSSRVIDLGGSVRHERSAREGDPRFARKTRPRSVSGRDLLRSFRTATQTVKDLFPRVRAHGAIYEYLMYRVIKNALWKLVKFEKI